jgi:hypothetical protein
MCTRRKSIDLPSVPDVYLEKTIDLPSVSDVYPEKNTDLPTKYSKYSCIEYTAPWEGFELTTIVAISTECTSSSMLID